jgi:hypothetical protein
MTGLFLLGFLFGLLFSPEDDGVLLFRNIRLSPNYMDSISQKTVLFMVMTVRI